MPASAKVLDANQDQKTAGRLVKRCLANIESILEPDRNEGAVPCRICPSHDQPGAGAVACGTARQDLRTQQLRPMPFRRQGDPESAEDRAALPNPASSL